MNISGPGANRFKVDRDAWREVYDARSEHHVYCAEIPNHESILRHNYFYLEFALISGGSALKTFGYMTECLLVAINGKEGNLIMAIGAVCAQ